MGNSDIYILICIKQIIIRTYCIAWGEKRKWHKTYRTYIKLNAFQYTGGTDQYCLTPLT